MRLSYKLKNGCHIKIFDYDILEAQAENREKYWRKTVSGYLTDTNDEDTEFDFLAPVLKENDRFYFMAFGQKIYFDDYEYLSLDELNQRLDSEEYVSNDVIVATLMKNADEVIFVEPRRIPDLVYTDICVRSYSGKAKYKNVICEPTKDYYVGYNWAYKIRTIPIDEEEKQIFGKEAHYSDDYCRWINSGYVKIISRDKVKDYELPKEKPFTKRRIKED